MKEPQPNPIDVLMGEVIRRHRKRCELSQTQLGRTAGISVQQMQKYEAGTNRVSISRLFQLAEALETPAYFLVAEVQQAAMDGSEANGRGASVLSVLSSPSGQALVEAISLIESKGMFDALETIAATAQQFARLAELREGNPPPGVSDFRKSLT